MRAKHILEELLARIQNDNCELEKSVMFEGRLLLISEQCIGDERALFSAQVTSLSDKTN